MSEEIDKHVLRKYEIGQRIGKGVRAGVVKGHRQLYVVDPSVLVEPCWCLHCSS